MSTLQTLGKGATARVLVWGEGRERPREPPPTPAGELSPQGLEEPGGWAPCLPFPPHQGVEGRPQKIK